MKSPVSPHFRLFFVLVLFANAFSWLHAATSPAWSHKAVAGDVAYFVFATPARIERYDMASEQWMPSIPLPSSPTAFAVDGSIMVIAYNRSVVTRALDGTGEAGLINMAQDVKGLLLSNELIFVIAPTYSSPSITSVRRSDRQFGATWSSTYAFGSGFAIAPVAKCLYGINTMTSGGDLNQLRYNLDGTFPSGGFKSAGSYYYTSSAYPRTYVSPDEKTLILGAGYVFDSQSLAYRASLAGSFDDMAFHGADVPILLRGNKLFAYSNVFLESGTSQLTSSAQAVGVRAGQVYAFSGNAVQPSGVAVEKVAVSSFSAAQPGAPVNPEELIFIPDNVISAGDGTFFLFSKAYQSVFRWSAATGRYVNNYPLIGSASFVAYSASLNRLYTAYASGQINQIKLDAGSVTEEPFANLAGTVRGLQTAGSLIFATDDSGSWNTHYVFASDGVLKSSKDWSYYSRNYVWSPLQQRMYFFRDDTSPNDILYVPIDAAGQLGVHKDSPYHGTYSFIHPIRLSTDETGVLVGSGVVFAAADLVYAGSIANSINDAVSRNNRWVTIRTTVTETQLQTWTQNLLFESGLTLPGYPLRIFNLPDGRLFVLTTTGWNSSNYTNAGRLIMSVVDLTGAGSVKSSPIIVTDPVGTTAYRGLPATLSVTAQGTGLVYEWRKNGQAIAGATSATLSIASVQDSDAGSYTVAVSNADGRLISAAATLTVQAPPPPPVITSQPQSRIGILGGTANFSVSATGAVLAYQWRKEGVAISGATSSSLSLTGISSIDYGNYDVVVSNPAGAVASNVVSLSAPPPPIITSQPQSVTVALGGTASFSIGASGSGLTYQWRKEGNPISGATSSYLNMYGITSAAYGAYDVMVSNQSGSVGSNAVTLSAPPPPTINTQPKSAVGKVGNYVTFSASAVGSGLTYQWRKDGVAMPSKTSSLLSVGPITVNDYGTYDVVITNSSGSVTSTAVTLTAVPTVRISNLSVRSNLAAGRTLIAGFVTNTGNKDVLIRAAGPVLDSLGMGLSGLPDPQISIYSGANMVRQNDDWASSLSAMFAQVGAFPFAVGSKDAALLLNVTGTGSSTRTCHVSGGVGTGMVLVEAYDATADTETRLVNVSVRNRVGTGSDILIAGFVIDGEGTQQVLIRGLGPALTKFDVTNALSDPVLTVFSGDSVIATNDNWSATLTSVFAQVGAVPLDSGSADAALLLTLSPGVYTVHVAGKGGSTGEALVEVYESN